MGLKPFNAPESQTREFAGWLTPDPKAEEDAAEVIADEVSEVVNDVDTSTEDQEEKSIPTESDTEEDVALEVVTPYSEGHEIVIDTSVSITEDEIAEEDDSGVTPDVSDSSDSPDEVAEVSTAEAGDKVWEHAAYYCCNNPALEAINVIEAYNMNFSLGSAYKYLIRAGKKTTSSIKDLDKSIQYLRRAKEKNLSRAALSSDLPSAADIIFEFDLNYYTGVAVSNLLQYLKTDQVGFLDTAIDTLTDYFRRLTELDYDSWREAGGIANG